MKSLTAALITMIALISTTALQAATYETRCTPNFQPVPGCQPRPTSGWQSRHSLQGCAPPRQPAPRGSNPRFTGPDVVPSPLPANAKTATAKGRYVQHTVGRPNIACDGKTVDVPVRQLPAKAAARGYFYSSQRTGFLGLRGRVVQYHEYTR